MNEIDLWYRMKRIRLIEEAIAHRYGEQKMRCPTHLSIGQELAGTLAGMILRRDDFAVSSHRNHAHYLGKGGNLNAMIAEIYGKSTGCSRGRGGSMHLVDESVGFMGATAIVANSIPIGVGLGLACQMDAGRRISCIFLGDGATEEGVFFESVNFAAVRKLPVLFVCENNFYSVYSPLSVRQPEGRKIHMMVSGLNISSSHKDSSLPREVFEGMAAAADHVRSGQGPFFIEISTYRWREHCGPNFDDDLPYRNKAEIEFWKKRDSLNVLESALTTEGKLTPESIDHSVRSITGEINTAFEFAEKSPYPDPSEAYIDEYFG